MFGIKISDWIQIGIAFITLVGIISSIVIAVLTLRQNNKIIRESNRANIVFYIDYNPGCNMYFLIIKNFGNSIGKLLSVAITPKLSWDKTKFKQHLVPLTEAKDILLAPNQKVSSWFDFKDYPDKKFSVIVKYETLGKKYVEKYTIDLNYINNIDWLNQYAFDDHTKDYKNVLYKINSSIKDLTDKFR